VRLNPGNCRSQCAYCGRRRCHPHVDLDRIFCRAIKPQRVKWLLGEEEPANFNIEQEGIKPRATWRASPRIVRWGITWRQESLAVPASLGILGETPNVMVSTGFSVLKVDYANDSIWDDAIVALIAVHLVVEGDGEDDHIAVIMNAKLCHHACCTGANDKGMQFASGFAEEAEDMVFAFWDVNS
jgi:hypothetical protein